ncbi:MAG: hypothetical protein FWH12_02215 [Treponema sp.]|nr:hypothetical protein [Treponema sp.]
MIEINKTHFCSTGEMIKTMTGEIHCHGKENNQCEFCRNYKKKWLTVREFEREHWRPYPDEGAVYYIDGNDPNDVWGITSYGDAKDDERFIIVCACTPWGCPPNDWRPV